MHVAPLLALFLVTQVQASTQPGTSHAHPPPAPPGPSFTSGNPSFTSGNPSFTTGSTPWMGARTPNTQPVTLAPAMPWVPALIIHAPVGDPALQKPPPTAARRAAWFEKLEERVALLVTRVVALRDTLFRSNAEGVAACRSRHPALEDASRAAASSVGNARAATPESFWAVKAQWEAHLDALEKEAGVLESCARGEHADDGLGDLDQAAE